MEIISQAEFKQICNDNQTVIIHYGAPGQPKVLLKNDELIVKLFYPKKDFITYDRIKPRALRFCENSKRLREQGYIAPEISKILYCQESKIYLLQYPKIQGKDIHKTVTQSQNFELLHDVARYVAELHSNGIFFRSIHLENVLHTADNQFALIDLTDVRFKSRPLSLSVRYRNIKHLFKTERDQPIWKAFGKEIFLQSYFKHTKLFSFQKKLLSLWLLRSSHA